MFTCAKNPDRMEKNRRKDCSVITTHMGGGGAFSHSLESIHIYLQSQRVRKDSKNIGAMPNGQAWSHLKRSPTG